MSWASPSALHICHGKTRLIDRENRSHRRCFTLWNVWRVGLLFPPLAPLSSGLWISHSLSYTSFTSLAPMPSSKAWHIIIGNRDVNAIKGWSWFYECVLLLNFFPTNSSPFKAFSASFRPITWLSPVQAIGYPTAKPSFTWLAPLECPFPPGSFPR